jgi:hypothetical protein
MFGSKFNRWAAEKYHSLERCGVKISGYRFRGELTDEDYGFVGDAIGLLESCDPDRFARFRNFFDFRALLETSPTATSHK